MPKTKKKRSRYQDLVAAKVRQCQGRTTKGTVRKKANAYIKYTVNNMGIGASVAAKRKIKAEAKRKAAKVLNKSCQVTAYVGKKRKKRVGSKLKHVLVMDGSRKRRRRKKY